MPEITPLVVSTNLLRFLNEKSLSNQIEKVVKKRGENQGFTDNSFELMMKAVGWRSGQAWCAYYVKLVFMQMYSFDRDYLAKNFTGGAVNNLTITQNNNKRGDKRYVAITSGSPQIGDIFVLSGHTGIVLNVISGNKVQTIEGNTNFKGSREGDKTESITRDLTIGKKSYGQSVLGFIRRVFTQEELSKLAYDEKQQTFIFTK